MLAPSFASAALLETQPPKKAAAPIGGRGHPSSGIRV
jgi:hypothetical protein